MKLVAHLLLTMLFSGEIYAQNAASGNRPQAVVPRAASSSTLQVVSSVKTQFQGTNFNQIACDAYGNLYTRKYDDSGPAFDRAPVQQIRPDGSLSSSLALPDTLTDGIITDFFVASNSKVYLLGWARTVSPPGYGAYVLRFATNGALEANVQVDAGQRFFPSHIGIFKSGEILITGRQGEMDHSPFTGVFSSNGKLIKSIFEPEDEDLRQRARAGDPDVLAHSNFGNEAVELGGVAEGADGNIYLLRRTSPALIFVISSQGTVVRKLRIDAGDSTAFPTALQSFSGGLAILFGNRAGGSFRMLKVVNFKGESVAVYTLDDGSWLGDLACYSPPTFTFLTPAKDAIDGFMDIRRAEPK
jgi:hypothetical protein